MNENIAQALERAEHCPDAELPHNIIILEGLMASDVTADEHAELGRMLSSLKTRQSMAGRWPGSSAKPIPR